MEPILSDLLVCGYIRGIQIENNLSIPWSLVQYIGILYPKYKLISNCSNDFKTIPIGIIHNPYDIHYYNQNQLIIKNDLNQMYLLSINEYCTHHPSILKSKLQSQLYKNIEFDHSYQITAMNDKIQRNIPTMFALRDGEMYRFVKGNHIPEPLKKLGSIKTHDIFMNEHNITIKQIACSDKGILLLTNKDGMAWWISTTKSMCLRSGSSIHATHTTPYNIVQIASGVSHNYFLLSESHKLYCFGENSYGQLGIFAGRAVHSYFVLNPVFQDKNIIKVVAGFDHTLLIDEYHQCYMFGKNHCGQTGSGVRSRSVLAAVHIQRVHKCLEHTLIVDGWLGDTHSIVMDDMNDLYVFGDNRKYQISQKCPQKIILIPFKLTKETLGIHSNDKIIKIIVDQHNTYIIVESSTRIGVHGVASPLFSAFPSLWWRVQGYICTRSCFVMVHHTLCSLFVFIYNTTSSTIFPFFSILLCFMCVYCMCH
eukprot:195754_1